MLERTLLAHLWEPTDALRRATKNLTNHAKRKEYREAAECQTRIIEAESEISVWTHLLKLYEAERQSDSGAVISSTSFTLDEVISAALKPFGGSREYGTPRPPVGLFCKLCGAEAVFGQVMKHDASCLLWPHEMEATMTPNDQALPQGVAKETHE